MPGMKDGPCSPLFSPVSFRGGIPVSELAKAGMSKQMLNALPHAPSALLLVIWWILWGLFADGVSIPR